MPVQCSGYSLASLGVLDLHPLIPLPRLPCVPVHWSGHSLASRVLAHALACLVYSLTSLLNYPNNAAHDSHERVSELATWCIAYMVLAGVIPAHLVRKCVWMGASDVRVQEG